MKTNRTYTRWDDLYYIEPKKITLKEKIKLLFKPMKVIKDVTRDFMLITYYKEMDGKIYVIRDEKIDY